MMPAHQYGWVVPQFWTFDIIYIFGWRETSIRDGTWNWKLAVYMYFATWF